jgi:crotonobetainyl-CoA:carnitine CoA-transferase CaiB-like acyl-CoA transferase
MAQHVLRTVGGEALVDDRRFRTNADRIQHVHELDELIAGWCRTRDREQAIEELTSGGCAVGPLESVATMLDNPQVRHRRSIRTVEDEELGPLAMTGIFPSFQDAPTSIGRPGPADVGADTDEVLGADLGLAPEDLAELRRAGVTAGPSTVPAERQQDAV